MDYTEKHLRAVAKEIFSIFDGMPSSNKLLLEEIIRRARYLDIPEKAIRDRYLRAEEKITYSGRDMDKTGVTYSLIFYLLSGNDLTLR